MTLSAQVTRREFVAKLLRGAKWVLLLLLLAYGVWFMHAVWTGEPGARFIFFLLAFCAVLVALRGVLDLLEARGLRWLPPEGRRRYRRARLACGVIACLSLCAAFLGQRPAGSEGAVAGVILCICMVVLLLLEYIDARAADGTDGDGQSTSRDR